MNDIAKKKAPGWLAPALDYGPLLVFFLVYKLNSTAGDPIQTLKVIIAATGAFMISITVAVVISKWKLGRISPMMWLSAILVLVFGGLTIYFHDPKFIQIKPTIIYTILSGLLFGGLFKGKPLLKYVLEHGYDGLSDKGWMLLSRNWAWFFAAMAVFNQVLVASVSFDTWLTIKVWGITILSIVFAAANVPMLMKHGLGEDQTPPTPSTQ